MRGWGVDRGGEGGGGGDRKGPGWGVAQDGSHSFLQPLYTALFISSASFSPLEVNKKL